MNNLNTFHRAFIRFGFTQKTFFHTSPNKINVKKFARLSGLSGCGITTTYHIYMRVLSLTNAY